MKRKTYRQSVFSNINVSIVQDQVSIDRSLSKLDSPESAESYFQTVIKPEGAFRELQENLIVIGLNTRHRVIGHSIVSIGSVCESLADPRDIFRPLVVSNAFAFILMHNHPSNDVSPSEMDRTLTKRISELSKMMRVNMLDHVIVAANPYPFSAGISARYFSFKEAGLL